MNTLNRPFTLIKTAMSLDGCIDDMSDKRLILSNQEDREAVDELKSTFDAILIGAETVRKDNPSLLIKSARHINRRKQQGHSEHPIKITITSSGNLNDDSRFFQEGTNEKLVYCPNHIEEIVERQLGKVATVIGLKGDHSIPYELLQDLNQRGISRLLIEGGGAINSMFLREGLVDAMRIAIAPFFVGESTAPRLIMPTKLPQDKNNRMKLERTEILGDMTILHYRL